MPVKYQDSRDRETRDAERVVMQFEKYHQPQLVDLFHTQPKK